MLKRIFSAQNIDFDQWKALLRTAIRLANRQSSLRFDSSSSRAKDMNYSLVLSFFLYGVLGLVMTSFVFKIHDLFWSSMIIFTIVGFTVGSLMLIEFGTIVVAPEDYHIFSVQPVSSRTYFAAKVTFAVMYVVLYTLTLGMPSVVVFGIRRHIPGGVVSFDPAPMVAGFVALLMVGIGVSMAMILLYATILHYVHIQRLNRVLSYLQLLMSFIIYGSYSLLPSLIEKAGTDLPRLKPWWIYLLPMSWYSAFVDVATGSLHLASIAVAVVGVLFFLGVIPIAFSKISLTYAESLAEASTVPEDNKIPTTTKSKNRGVLFGRPEDRAIATLIRVQFKHDTRFRLGVLAIIPLTILYILMGLRGGGRLFDPFNPDWKTLGNSALLYLVVVLFPMTIKEAVTRSESFLASWIFFVTPAEKVRLVLSVKRILFWFFVVPYVLALGAVFLYYFQNVLHVLMHVLVLLLFSYSYLQILLLVNPQMPFSVPRQLGERATMLGTVLFLGPLLLMGMLLFFSFFVYGDTLAYIGSVGALILIAVSMERLLVQRVTRKLGQLEFRG